MKKKKGLFAQVFEADYTIQGDKALHSPASTMENLKRHDKILAKMRKAGVTEDEIEFLSDFWQADALHVTKLCAAADAHEGKKSSLN